MSGHTNAFVPSIEVDMGQDVFLPTDPWTLLKSGRIADVPVMSGITADECAFMAQSMRYLLFLNESYYKLCISSVINLLIYIFQNVKYHLNVADMIDKIDVLNTEPEQFLPDDLNYTDSNTKKESGQSLKKFYFGEKQVSKDNLNEYIRVITVI